MHRLIPLFLILFFVSVQAMSGQASDTGYLVLNEISPWPSNQTVWVEFINPSDSPCPLDGYNIKFLSGFEYTFPENSDEIPSGGIHTLNIGGGNPLNPDGDGCRLTGPDGLVDQLSWGTPDNPIGSPLRPIVETYREGDNLIQPDDVCIRYPYSLPDENQNYIGSGNWTLRTGEEASPGEPNPMPGPTGIKPTPGTRLASNFNLAVMGLDWAAEISFQIATDENFENIVLDVTCEDYFYYVSDLPAGLYYWRSRADGGAWHPTHEFTVMPYTIGELIEREQQISRGNIDPDKFVAAVKGGGPPGLELAGTERCTAWRILGISHIRQHKDTDMVCLDGCEMEGFYPWDGEHNPGRSLSGGHNRWYCARACIAMIAAHAGQTLSQDRISYYMFEEAGSATSAASASGHLNDPFKDLGHDLGVSGRDIARTLDWLYRGSGATAPDWTSSLFNDGDGSDMDTIVDFIDDNRPVVRDIGSMRGLHSTLIDGYAIVQLGEDPATDHYVRVLDPWIPNSIEWESIGFDRTMGLEFPPTTGSPSRRDEPGVSRDSDGDGLCDFDETERFGTDPNDTDSDDDNLDDKIDMLGYLFNTDGTYNLRDPDIDGDEVAKELDPDNDRAEDNGLVDGCEDVDQNGFFRSGAESDNFNADDDFTVPNPECFSGIIKIEANGTLSSEGFAVPFTVNEMIELADGVTSRRGGFVHEHTWEISGTSVFAIAIPGVGPISCCSDGSGEGTAQITVTVDRSGNYRMVTDTNPRIGNYIIDCGSSVTSHQFHFGFGDHHFDYYSADTPGFMHSIAAEIGPPNVFEGQVQRTPDGNLLLEGTDYNSLAMANLTTYIERSWTLIVAPP